MPFLAPVFVAIGSFATAVSATVGGLAAAALGGGAFGIAVGGAVADGVFALAGGAGLISGLTAWSTVGLLASSALSTPAVGGVTGNPTQFQADPTAGVPYVAGRTAFAGTQIYLTASEDPKFTWRHYFGVLSAGPIQAVEAFYADISSNPTAVNFSGTTHLALFAPFAGKMGLTFTTGTESDAVLSLPDGTGPTNDWASTDTLPGLAGFRWCLKADSALYSGGPPPPLFVLTGPTVYDMRLDDTFPGGSGSNRATDQTTWTGDATNPFLQGVSYVLGRILADKPFLGLGAPIDTIDMASFAHGANVCEANSWTCGGVIFSTDDPLETLKAYLQAGGGAPLILGGSISCFVQAPAVAVDTISLDDVVGPISRDRNPSRTTLINQVIASYRSEDHNWQVVPADAYQVDDYVTANGLKQQPVTYPLVQDATQARQLAAYGIYDAHEFTVNLTFGPRWRALQPGDTFTPGTDLANKLRTSTLDLKILTTTIDPETLKVTLVCRSETAGKHDAALGLTGGAPPVPTALVPDKYAPAPAPAFGAWSLTGTSQTSPTGITLPALEVSGALDNPAADAVFLDLSTDGTTILSSLGKHPRDFTDAILTDGIQDSTAYYVFVSYEVRGRRSDIRALGPVTAGVFIGGGGGGGGGVSDGSVLLDSSKPGSFSSTMPMDGFLDIEIWGAGGWAQSDLIFGDVESPSVSPASGAGGGAYSKKHITITAGDTIAGSIGSSFFSDGSATTVTSPSMSAGGGGAGSVDHTSTTPGTGGTASGGDTNTSGHDGGLTTFTDGGSAGNGGGDQTTAGGAGTSPGGGGAGGPTGGGGAAGRVLLTFRSS